MKPRKWRTSTDLGFAALVAIFALIAGTAYLHGPLSGVVLLALLIVPLGGVLVLYGMLRRSAHDGVPATTGNATRINALLDALPVNVLLFDRGGHLLCTNGAWRTFARKQGVVLDGAGAQGPHYRSLAAAFTSSAQSGEGSGGLAEGIRSVLVGKAHGFDGEFALQISACAQWVHIAVRPFECEHGRCALVLALDITDRRAAEERRDLLSAALNASSHAVVITDPSAVIEWANPAFATLAGRAPAETVGCTPSELLRSAGEEIAFKPGLGDTVASTGDVRPRELVDKPDKAAALQYAAMKVTPVRDSGGTLRHLVGIREEVRERKLHERELRRLACTDALTGVRNRRTFLDEAALERARVHRYCRRSALLVLDLDHFSRINELHGRATGDVVLKHFARLASSGLRQPDIIGRLDQNFAILLTETDLDGAVEFAERLRRKVSRSVMRNGRSEIRITVSIGIAGFKREDPNVEAVLARAASALQLAKSGGRNRVECAQAE